MKFRRILWLEAVVEKLALKHAVQPEEVEEALASAQRARFVEKGDWEGEDLYAALGRTEAGRYLIVYYLRKADGDCLVVSARDMDRRERKAYGKK
jgi:uncharacterized DUF497 family protein